MAKNLSNNTLEHVPTNKMIRTCGRIYNDVMKSHFMFHMGKGSGNSVSDSK